MDEVIADINAKHLNVYNRDFDEQLTLDDLRSGRIADIHPHRAPEILAYLRDPLFFRDLEVIQDSQEVISKLNDKYEVFITTAAMEFPSCMMAKYEWLKEHFSFLNEMNFVFCGDKSIVSADFLIDDNASHFRRFCGRGILYTAPHNWNVTGYERVNSWRDAEAYFLK